MSKADMLAGTMPDLREAVTKELDAGDGPYTAWCNPSRVNAGTERTCHQ